MEVNELIISIFPSWLVSISKVYLSGAMPVFSIPTNKLILFLLPCAIILFELVSILLAKFKSLSIASKPRIEGALIVKESVKISVLPVKSFTINRVW